MTIQNTPPTLSGLMISPAGAVYNDDILTCSVTVTDPDEVLNPSYEWLIDGSSVGTSASLDLASLGLLPDDSVTCAVSVMDSDGEMDTDSMTVILGNRPPVIAGVQITPSVGVTASSSLSCLASITDDDGEVLTPSHSWMINSITYTDSVLNLSLTSGYPMTL